MIKTKKGSTTTTEEKAKTAVKLGTPEMPVRISYAKIWEPKATKDGGKLKYGLSVIISKDDVKTLRRIEKAVEAAKEAGSAKWGGKVPKNLKTPLRDGDAEREDDAAYEGAMFLNASSETAPGIMELVNGKLKKVTDRAKVYSGCFCVVSVNFYPYFTEGSKGVACGLNNILKIEDGEPLAGRASAEDDFKNYGELDEDDDDEDYDDEDYEDENDEDDDEPAPKKKKPAPVKPAKKPVAAKAKRKPVVEDDDEDEDEY